MWPDHEYTEYEYTAEKNSLDEPKSGFKGVSGTY